MKKRGVSPLIATVLLIAFVIIIFVLITTWVRKSAIEPSMTGAEEKLASALECINTADGSYMGWEQYTSGIKHYFGYHGRANRRRTHMMH